MQSNETALLGALLNRGRKVRRLPKFDQLTPAHFSNPLHAALLLLYRQDKSFSQTHNLQARANILKSQPAFAAIPDHRAFLENLMISETDPVRALRSLLDAGPVYPENSSIQITITPSAHIAQSGNSSAASSAPAARSEICSMQSAICNQPPPETSTAFTERLSIAAVSANSGNP